MTDRTKIAIAAIVLVGIAIHETAPILSCPASCLPDYAALHGEEVGTFETADARMNAWVLGWVQHAGFSEPAKLFDGNAFFPIRGALTGTDHMIGNALLTLPVRWFSDDPVALHQIAMALSFVLLGLSTFGFVAWTSGSAWAALLAGVMAMYMPWRFSELSHLPLLSAQWIPLIWWLTIRVLIGEASRRDALLLGVALALQLLTSFTLAYFTLISVACLMVVVALQTRPGSGSWTRWLSAAALPGALFIASGVAYLERYSAFGGRDGLAHPGATSPGLALSVLAPSATLRADTARLAELGYFVPLVVFALALLAFARNLPLMRARGGRDDREPRMRAVCVGLLAVIGVAVVSMWGHHLDVGGWQIPSLGALFARLLPGFSLMHAEFRWGIAVGLAFPVLAGIGVAVVERAIGRTTLRIAANASIGALVALATSGTALPMQPAWDESADIRAAHEALAGMPAGTTVELKFGLNRSHMAIYGSRYMLASAQHWNPLLNGYSSHPPAAHHIFQRRAMRLPHSDAIAELRRMTDLRWVIVHFDKTWGAKDSRWEGAVRKGEVELAASIGEARIYRVTEQPDGGSLLDTLRSRHSQTLGGVSKEPLDVAAAVGHLGVFPRAMMRYDPDFPVENWARLEIVNRSPVDWPGLDVQTDGLVALRYRFADADGNSILEATAALDSDIRAGQTIEMEAIIFAPARAGHYAVRFDLVQRVGDELRALAIAPVERGLPVERTSNPSRVPGELRDPLPPETEAPRRPARRPRTR